MDVNGSYLLVSAATRDEENPSVGPVLSHLPVFCLCSASSYVDLLTLHSASSQSLLDVWMDFSGHIYVCLKHSIQALLATDTSLIPLSPPNPDFIFFLQSDIWS